MHKNSLQNVFIRFSDSLSMVYPVELCYFEMADGCFPEISNNCFSIFKIVFAAKGYNNTSHLECSLVRRKLFCETYK